MDRPEVIEVQLLPNYLRLFFFFFDLRLTSRSFLLTKLAFDLLVLLVGQTLDQQLVQLFKVAVLLRDLNAEVLLVVLFVVLLKIFALAEVHLVFLKRKLR